MATTVNDADDLTSFNIPPEFRDLKWREEKLTVRDLWSRIASGDINLEPDFQRHFVWDRTRSSRFIESLILNLPVPPIFIAEEEDGTWSVVDGHQRLETIVRFMLPLLKTDVVQSNRSKSRQRPPLPAVQLILRDLEVMTELNGRSVNDLSPQNRQELWNRTITVVRILRDSHPDMKFALFARLNLGSVSLNPQELRNCIYRGPFNRLIAELAESNQFLGLWSRKAPGKRMEERELVLRFFAFLHQRDRYCRPLKIFLNREMEEFRDVDQETLNRFRRQFQGAQTWVQRVFGSEAFRRFVIGNQDDQSGRWERRRSRAIYDLEMVGFAYYIESLERIYNQVNDLRGKNAFIFAIRSGLIDVMTNERFIESLTARLFDENNVKLRYELWLSKIGSIITDYQRMIENMFRINKCLSSAAACEVCMKPVSSPDDAKLDATPQRDRVLHRYCYRARAASGRAVTG